MAPNLKFWHLKVQYVYTALYFIQDSYLPISQCDTKSIRVRTAPGSGRNIQIGVYTNGYIHKLFIKPFPEQTILDDDQPINRCRAVCPV